MTTADRWLLPDGVEEIQPAQAERMERLRRQMLDLYHSWGYELVITPLVEYTESLLIGLGQDLDTQTFKVTDQLTGRTMAIRPDITPQTARMDAHSLNREGPVRLCYADSVLHTTPRALLAPRSPFQVGAELYGDASAASDIEIISLMLETLSKAGLDNITLDLGHVGIYKELVSQVGLNTTQEAEFFDALQRKASAEINDLLVGFTESGKQVALLSHLAELHGGMEVLAKARSLLAPAGEVVLSILDSIESLAAQIAQRYPEINLFFDLNELHGYHYHTGLVFTAYTPGFGRAVANGGRYDDIGAVFGRARPATGFNLDLKAIIGLLGEPNDSPKSGIFAPQSEDPALWEKIQVLRAQGYRVVGGLGDQAVDSRCDQILVNKEGEWLLAPASDQSTKS